MSLADRISTPISEAIYHANALLRLRCSVEMAERGGERDVIAEQQLREQLASLDEEVRKIERALDEQDLDDVMRTAI